MDDKIADFIGWNEVRKNRWRNRRRSRWQRAASMENKAGFRWPVAGLIHPALDSVLNSALPWCGS